MQTIYLDISNKGVVPTIYAKQGDVGRKFEVVLTDSGLPYVPANGSAFSVWYSGASGEGNYTDIGDKSAFSVNGNKVAVEMISQMLLNDGDGVLSLALNDPNGNQISTWNIPYVCEYVPGADSEEAKYYYTAFSKAVENLPYPDSSLSVIGKAADAAATGKAIENITVDSLMAAKLAGKRIVMLGDSNAAGSGWYSVAGGVKNETNDGVFAVLREMLPETTFKNYAVGGAGFVQGTNIMQQMEEIEGTPDIIFVWAGGNDISAYIGGSSAVILNAPNMQDYNLEAFDNSLYGKVNQTLYTLRQRYPFAKICGVIRTYKMNADLASQRNIYGTIARLYQKYQCSVINLNDFSNVVDYITEQKDYWKDAIHYSEYCFRHLLAPIFYAAICNNLNINTYIPVDTMYTNETANNLANPLTLAFQVGMNKSTCVTLQNYPKKNFSIFAGGRYDAGSAAAFRLPTQSNNVEFYRERNGATYSCRMDHTEYPEEGVDVATLDHGRYIFTSYVGPLCAGIPEGLSGAFMIDITVTPSGAKYAQLHYWGGNSLWVGVMAGSESAFTWKKVTA